MIDFAQKAKYNIYIDWEIVGNNQRMKPSLNIPLTTWTGRSIIIIL